MTYVEDLSRDALEKEWADLHAKVGEYEKYLVAIGKAMKSAKTCPVCEVRQVGSATVHRKGCGVWEAILAYHRWKQD